MMRKTFIWLSTVLGLLLFSACANQTQWPSNLCRVNLRLVYPAGYQDQARAGVEVAFSSISSDQTYKVKTDAAGGIDTQLPAGLYRIQVSDRIVEDDDEIYLNGILSRCLVIEDCVLDLSLVAPNQSPLVIRELYVGGCSKAPKEGTYQSDQYVVLHNNGSDVQYLDSLCFGTLSPYNSVGVNHWLGEDGSFPPFAPVVTVVWRFPGTGTSFPLAPGADAVIALRGAIDHTQEYPLSVNLNLPDCFACYNPTLFPNPLYHPAPGDKIRQDHILDVVIKTGQSNANTISVSSPTFLIFKAQGVSIDEWVTQEDKIAVSPGNSADVVVKVPWEWVMDAVEVFDGSSSGNNKRLPPSQDAGYVSQTETFKGYVLTRRIHEKKTAVAGFTILKDTNNSSNDFYETTQSLLRP